MLNSDGFLDCSLVLWTNPLCTQYNARRLRAVCMSGWELQPRWPPNTHTTALASSWAGVLTAVCNQSPVNQVSLQCKRLRPKTGVFVAGLPHAEAGVRNIIVVSKCGARETGARRLGTHGVVIRSSRRGYEQRLEGSHRHQATDSHGWSTDLKEEKDERGWYNSHSIPW